MDFSIIRRLAYVARLRRSATAASFAPSLVVIALVAGSGYANEPVSDEELRARGKKLYAEQCADCHGAVGEGVESAYEMPLVGDDSVGQLAKTIADTMPEGEPEMCAGTDAEAVASYVHHAFYSEAARIRNRPPRIGLARLTAEQLRQSLADLYRTFDDRLPEISGEHGLKGEYSDGDRNRKKKIERIDPQLNFDFGRESPGEGIKPEAFYIEWEGGLHVPESGRYEIVVESSCSFIMDFGARDRELINNHVQSGDKTEFRRSLQLTGGRIYPLRIEFRQRKRKTELPPARISLRWVPPGGVEQVIPPENLVPDRCPNVFALQAVLPPDDRSYGFERGLTVNRAWDESTTAAALEFADIAFNELWPSYQRRHRKDPNDNRQQLKGFISELLERAMRGQWSTEDRKLFVDAQVDAEPDNREALKRCMLVGLKSPRFLYPSLPSTLSPSRRAANSLALVLMDSLPSESAILKRAERGQLATEQEIRSVAKMLVGDFRTRAKVTEFMHEWLNLGHISQITKDPEQFPGFDARLQHDLRRSLDRFMEDVIWEDGDYRKLFTAGWGYSTQRMGTVLGDPWKPTADAEGDDLLYKTEADKTLRGVLTHPFLLSGLAYFDGTSPIHRGVFLIRHVLGRTLRPPSDAFTPLSPDLHPMLTTRERVALQTSPESCQVCHSKINALGFALEGFDAIGRLQSEENGRQIDASGNYTSRGGEEVNFADHADLAAYIVTSEDAHTAFVRKAFQHFVKQPPAAYGPETLQMLVKRFQENEFNIPKLIEEIAVVAALRAADGSPTATNETAAR
ncbi:MAG: PA14 domain-containing protein [Aureliella sp.]